MPGEPDYYGLPDLAVLPSQDWLPRAKCSVNRRHTDFFFPVARGAEGLSVAIAEVKAYCRNCPVKKECLEWALAADCNSGMFGGKSEAEIRKIRKKRMGKVVPSGNRDKTHCVQEHPYNEMNTYVRPDGRRTCRACHKERNLEYRKREGI